jgi:hypothetical protein
MPRAATRASVAPDGVARIDVVPGVIDSRHVEPRDSHVDVLLTDEADRIAVIFEDQANRLVVGNSIPLLVGMTDSFAEIAWMTVRHA